MDMTTLSLQGLVCWEIGAKVIERKNQINCSGIPVYTRTFTGSFVLYSCLRDEQSTNIDNTSMYFVK